MTLHFRYGNKCKNLKNFSEDSIEGKTYKVLEYFSDLKNTSSLLFFDYRPNLYQNWRHGIATIFPLRNPFSTLKIEFPDLSIIADKLQGLDFVFHFTRRISEGDEITKTVHIAHEFQHAIQCTNYKRIYYYGRILCYFLSDSEIKEERIPIEYDALRKSKYVALSMFTQKEIDAFIKRMLEDQEFPKFIWAIFNSINTQKNYDLEHEVLKLWDHYYIEDEVAKLKKNPNPNSDEKMIIEMYDYANT